MSLWSDTLNYYALLFFKKKSSSVKIGDFFFKLQLYVLKLSCHWYSITILKQSITKAYYKQPLLCPITGKKAFDTTFFCPFWSCYLPFKKALLLLSYTLGFVNKFMYDFNATLYA